MWDNTSTQHHYFQRCITLLKFITHPISLWTGSLDVHTEKDRAIVRKLIKRMDELGHDDNEGDSGRKHAGGAARERSVVWPPQTQPPPQLCAQRTGAQGFVLPHVRPAAWWALGERHHLIVLDGSSAWLATLAIALPSALVI
mmetsp:Transcript_50247/g.98312  ORF Transcript_50247/g.98312 Transcript_50247/m.98312 type:complete len:142 (-) Transcript_50247:32-457(-)